MNLKNLLENFRSYWIITKFWIVCRCLDENLTSFWDEYCQTTPLYAMNWRWPCKIIRFFKHRVRIKIWKVKALLSIKSKNWVFFRWNIAKQVLQVAKKFWWEKLWSRIVISWSWKTTKEASRVSNKRNANGGHSWENQNLLDLYWATSSLRSF